MSDKDSSKNMISISSICKLLDFSGDGVQGFLNNLLISDLNELHNEHFNYTTLCNQKGRIVASLWIKVISTQQILMVCPSNMINELSTFFNQRKFRLKIDISIMNNNIVIDSQQEKIRLIQENESSKTNDETVTESFYSYLFENNLPWIDKNNTEKFIPQHVNLDQHHNIMSFTKGCYPGQEIIARIKFLGTIKKRMCLLTNSDKEKLMDTSIDMVKVSPIIAMNDGVDYSIQVIKPLKK
jgi:folate-binding protein YgfZ